MVAWLRRHVRVSVVAHAVLLALVVGLVARAAKEPKNDFHFAILGDRTGGHRATVYGRVWREVGLYRPDFVITVGDTIEGYRDAPAPQQWDEMKAIWASYKQFPFYLSPGNHDVWNEYSEKLYKEKTGQPLYYSFNYQDAHFVVLDNARKNGLRDDQLAFLEADLEKNKARQPIFVIFHRPYWIGTARAGNTDDPLHKLCKKYKVARVLSGHGHRLTRMVFDGVEYDEIGSSGGSIGKNPQFSQGRFYHWAWARVKGPQVNITIKEISGPLGKGRSFDLADWNGTAPQFDENDPAAKAHPGG